MLSGAHLDVQWSKHLHSLAAICIYAALNMDVSKQTSIENIYIFITYIYIFKAQYMHIWSAYMHIWRFIPLHTNKAAYIKRYIYIYICSTKPQNTVHKPLAMQEAAVSMI